jgi:hypothetical protein
VRGPLGWRRQAAPECRPSVAAGSSIFDRNRSAAASPRLRGGYYFQQVLKTHRLFGDVRSARHDAARRETARRAMRTMSPARHRPNSRCAPECPFRAKSGPPRRPGWISVHGSPARTGSGAVRAAGRPHITSINPELSCEYLEERGPFPACAANTNAHPRGGEHCFALFYQGDVRWENQFRRNRNRQKLCSWILLPYGS